MFKRVLTLLYHFFWYLFAIIIINAAVLVTAVRLALPEIGEYKNEIQSWVSEYMDYPVIIDDISAEWQGWIPHLYLKNIDLYSKDNSQIISRFDSASLGIDLMASLSQGEVVPSQLSVTGLNLELNREKDGSLSITSDKYNSTSTFDSGAALSDWLLKQRHIILEKASLTLNDKKNERPPKKFEHARIELKTDDDRIQLNASVILPDEYGQTLSMKMDITGNILTPNWSGKIYAQADNTNPGDLLEDFPVNCVDGNANIKLWTSWNNSRLIDFSGQVDYKNFTINSPLYELPVDSINVSVFGKRQNSSDWALDIKLEDFKTIHGLWPSSTYHVYAVETEDNQYKYSGQLSYFKIHEVLPFIISSNVLPEETLKYLDWQSVNGELKNLDFYFDPAAKPEKIFTLRSDFKDFSIGTSNKQSLISGLDGSLITSKDKLSIKLESQNTELKLGDIYEQPLTASSINADIDLTYQDKPELSINSLEINNEDLPLSLSGNIKLGKASPFIDLVAHIDTTDIENIPEYLPRQTEPELRNWLSRALVGGKLLSADMLFRGHINDFPFDEAEGHFKAILNIDNAILEYRKNWPAVDNLTAEVIINNNNLLVSSNSAYIFDAKINSINAEISDMGKQHLHVLVDSKLSGHTSDARSFIKESPLKDNPSLFEFSQANIAGGLEIDLTLDIPLDGNETIANGNVTFIDTIFESSLPGLGLEDINGTFEFTRDTVWSSKASALYHGKPVEIAIPKEEEHEPGTSSFIISGKADKQFIIEQLTRFFPSLYTPANRINRFFNGESQWDLTIKRQRVNENTINRSIALSSDLNGISIDLPYPLGKTKDEIRPVDIETTFLGSLIDQIDIQYDDKIFTNILVDNQTDFIVKKILVGLGNEHHAETENQDITIQGKLDRLDISEWMRLINTNKTSPGETQQIKKQERSILYDIHVGKLTLLDNEFNNTRLVLTKPDNDWSMFFEGDEIKGQAVLLNSVEKNTRQLNADLEYLFLNKQGDKDNDEPDYDIDKWPELDLKIDKFTYKDHVLGEAVLLTNKIENGMKINELSFNKPDLAIKAEGTWKQIDGFDRSELFATLDTQAVNNMLETFGYGTTNIKEGKTAIKLNANWMDSPMNFSLDKVNGELDIDISKGQFLDINPKAGRFFGLLSLQTLPRRLALDFSDIFNEGFTFDSITGNFTLQNGHAYTNDLELNSTSADIIVSGRTGLVTEDYDQIATVTPKISDTLPVASALFGPIGAGVGAVIFLAGELFESIPRKIDTILSTQYSIKGSWDEPDIEKIEKEKKSG